MQFIDGLAFYFVVIEKIGCVFRRKNLKAELVEHEERWYKLHLVFVASERYEDVLFRQTESRGLHGTYQRFSIRIAKTGYFAGRGHLDRGARVRTLDAAVRELR